MKQMTFSRRDALAASFAAGAAAERGAGSTESAAMPMSETRTFTKTATPAWLLAFWKEIDDKTWGKGFDCFKEDAVAHLGVGGPDEKPFVRTCVRSSIGASPPITRWPNSGTAGRSRCFGDL
jgi:hypothetical protein